MYEGGSGGQEGIREEAAREMCVPSWMCSYRQPYQRGWM